MESSASKSAKDLRDEKQRDSKLEDQVVKSLGGSSTSEEKFSSLLKKYIELEKDNKRLNATIKLHEKRHEAIIREKDNLQKEHNKSVLMRDKLEQVCREQQKLIKSVQNESLKHKETQAKFQQSINEISVTLNKNNEENIKLKDDNIDMTKKLKYLAEQYQIREKQLEKINEQIQLESQLHEAKLAKAQMEATIEKEVLLREKQVTLDDLLKSKNVIQETQKREELLKEQLNLYTSKYDDFQSSLRKSNEVFVTYKIELEKMVKKTKKLEKESSDWRRKCEKSTASLLDLATEKQVKDEHIVKTAKQMQQLQKLLRTLQAERTNLYRALKDHNIEIPAMPIILAEPEPVVVPPTKQLPDKMEKIAELKQSLALLQGQVGALSKKADETKAAETAKKNKNKKTKTRNKACSTKEKNQSAEQSTKANACAEEQNTINESEQGIQENENNESNGVDVEAKNDAVATVESIIIDDSNLVQQVENVVTTVQDLKIDSNSLDQSLVTDSSWEVVQTESVSETPNSEAQSTPQPAPVVLESSTT